MEGKPRLSTSIEAGAQKGALVQRVEKAPIDLNLAEGELETPLDINLAEGGEQNPNIIDAEGKHKDWLTPEEAHARREQFRPSKAAVAEAAVAAAAAKAAHVEIIAGVAREKAEAAVKAATVLENLKRKAGEAAAERIEEANALASSGAEALINQQEVTNPQGTRPEDPTVN